MLWKPNGRWSSLRETAAYTVVLVASSPYKRSGTTIKSKAWGSPCFCCFQSRAGGRTVVDLLKHASFFSFCSYEIHCSITHTLFATLTARVPINLLLVRNQFCHGRGLTRACTAVMVPTLSSLFGHNGFSSNTQTSAQPCAHNVCCPSGGESPTSDLSCPDRIESDCFATFSALSRGVIDGNALSYGRLLHAHLIKTSSDIQSLTELHLVQMYCKCGCLEDAHVLFNAIHPRQLVSTWNILISSLIKNSRLDEARWLFDQMLIEGSIPSKATFTSLTSACMCRAALTEGHRLHARVKSSDLCADVVVGTAFVIMYGKCSSLEKARLMFDSMPSRDVISWTALITTYVQHGKNKLAIEIFFLMEQDSINPSKVTFISILSACSSKDDLHVGKQLHAFIKKSGFESDVVIGNALLSMYGKCESVENARAVFDSMPERNLISWNAIIAVYAQNGEGKEALCIAYRMQQGTLPDSITFVSMLDACARLGALSDGKQIHSRISGSRLETNVTLGNALVNMYGKCGSLEEASKVFETMPERDEITSNALISAFATKGQGTKALDLFHRMQQEGLMPNKITFVGVLSACANQGTLTAGKQIHSSIASCEFELDVVVGTAIVNMYGKSCSSRYARQIFDRMPVRNVVCWTAMISAYAQNGQVHEAFTLFDLLGEKHDAVLWNSIIATFSQNGKGKRAIALFEQMLQEGVLPDRVTFVSSLDAATNEAVLGDGKHLHSRICGTPFEQDDVIQNALVSMYGKCGNLEVAWKLFEQSHKRDVFAWSSMIAAYAQIGLGKEALCVFTQMRQEGVIPDEVTFVNVLSACSHGGLVREGCKHFASMSDDYAITPMVDHYNCMIDLLGRSGQLDEAEKLILNMRVPPTVVSWLTLLSACQKNVDVKRGEWAAESLFKMDSNNATPYIMLSSIYNAAGRPIDAANVIFKMKCRGLN